MKIEVNENNEIILKEVFSGVGLVSESGESFGICMRDLGFEFNYGGYWYEAKEGRLSLLGPDRNEEDCPEDFDLDSVYSIGDFCNSDGKIWKYEGKLLRYLNEDRTTSHSYRQEKTVGVYPCGYTGWKLIR